MYIVTGVSGKTGGAVANVLLQRGERIRVVVRSKEKGAPWKARGAEIAITSFEDEKGFADALRGGDAIYLLVPPNLQTRDQDAFYAHMAEAFRGALTAVPLPHAIVLSAWGADQPHPFHQLHKMEEILQRCATPVTFLRASYFMENLEANIEEMRSRGVLTSFMNTEVKIPMVACRDIGELAADLMVQGRKSWSAIDLTGPEDYSMADVAQAYSKVLGRSIQTMRVPEDQVVASVMQWGASRESAEFYAEMYRAFDRRGIGPEGGDVPLRRGRTRLEDQVRELVTAAKSAYLG